MCIFSGEVDSVSNTKIFARSTRGNRQVVVYSMDFITHAELAMILPLPVIPESGEDAVVFIDMEGYPNFFKDMDDGFPPIRSISSALDDFSADPFLDFGSEPLDIHEVGLFEASYVPSHKDWNRLDQRFQLSSDLWKKMPQYRDYGFAVFKLNAGKIEDGMRSDREQTIHPIALKFPRKYADMLFFPTLHIHEGRLHSKDLFDHSLYCQCNDDEKIRLESSSIAWRISPKPAWVHMDVEPVSDLLRPNDSCYKVEISGYQENKDILF